MDRAAGARIAAWMVLLCASWGLQQVAIKVSLVDLAPFTQSAVRGAIASLAILAWAALRRRPLVFARRTRPAGLWLGLVFGVEYLLLYWGISLTQASRAGLFLYTSPFFVVLFGWWLLPGERLGLFQMGGLVLAFAGVATALGLHDGNSPPEALLGDCLVLGGAVLWACSTLIIKTTALQEASVEEIVLYQVAIGSAIAAAAAFAVGEQNHWPSPQTVLLLLYQAIWVGTFTFLVWFALVARYSANLMSAFTFLTPLFGIAAGHFLLGDAISNGFAAACVLVLVGLAVVNRPSPKRALPARELTGKTPSGRA